MNPIEQLREDARAKRDKALHEARAEYRATIRQLKILQRLMREPGDEKPRYVIARQTPADTSFCTLTAVKAAETVLRELGPLSLVDIVLTIQSRGCRYADAPRAVMNAVRTGFRYHHDKFTQDAEGRWGIL